MVHPLDRKAMLREKRERMDEGRELRSRLQREQRLEEIRKEAVMQHRAFEDSRNPMSTAPPEDVASLTTGYYGMPALKAPAWTWEVPLYFFTGGAAGSAAVLASVGRLTGADRALIRDARWLAAIGGSISPALLVSDLGMPSRFLHMLRVFKIQSAMSVGSWTLVAFSSSAAAAAVLAEIEYRRPTNRVPILSDAIEIASTLSGLALLTYTGVLIGATAIPVWNQNVSLLPMHFATSGVSAAAGFLELRGHQSKRLNRIATAAAAIDTLVGASLELRRKPAMKPLRTGASGWTMRAAGLLSGPIPLTLRVLAALSGKDRWRWRRVAALSAVLGSLVTRFAWVGAGRISAKDPTVPLQLPGPGKTSAFQLEQKPQEK